LFLSAKQAELAMPVVERNSVACRIVWKGGLRSTGRRD
jgi:hypothetical protein